MGQGWRELCASCSVDPRELLLCSGRAVALGAVLACDRDVQTPLQWVTQELRIQSRLCWGRFSPGLKPSSVGPGGMAGTCSLRAVLFPSVSSSTHQVLSQNASFPK